MRHRARTRIRSQAGRETSEENARSRRIASFSSGRDAKTHVAEELRTIFDKLFAAFGPQHWWPAQTRTEIVVGAILTQNTAWSNVERAIDNLRRARCLSWASLRDIAETELAGLIRPSGTFRVKARRLKNFVAALWTHHNGRLAEMLSGNLDYARERLLAISGVGPETADAILLYAGNHASFVADAYAHRILRRHALITNRVNYETLRNLFHAHLPHDPPLFNEYHALLVTVGKRFCGKTARCAGCPLEFLPHDPTA